jgi:hypothetical protein
MPAQASPVTPAQLRASSARENTLPGGAFGDDRSLAGAGIIRRSDMAKVGASRGQASHGYAIALRLDAS